MKAKVLFPKRKYTANVQRKKCKNLPIRPLHADYDFYKKPLMIDDELLSYERFGYPLYHLFYKMNTTQMEVEKETEYIGDPLDHLFYTMNMTQMEVEEETEYMEF
ncbi:uncharacterized protein LOC124368960 [Homalodisca vitripennis]|uniref:uncharacterized protein LOC124368960 n=1 Tax=Homalodisca vitripennis TaxID=197043 RepID=UPI001EEC9C99|nr:uncharacterized protein LOC124368960 [Homalodisca vitripennis]